jgi:hypothetical protein
MNLVMSRAEQGFTEYIKILIIHCKATPQLLSSSHDRIHLVPFYLGARRAQSVRLSTG